MSTLGDLWNNLTGVTAGEAATEAAQIQQQSIQEAIPLIQGATETAQGFLQPYQAVGQQGLDLSSFLTDPNQQYQFLQNNPLFQAALNNANTSTMNLAAAKGRLSAGDTLQQLSQNVLLSASPLINQRSQNIMQLLGLGANVAGTQAGTETAGAANIADLITSSGAVGAGGVAGAANAQTQGTQNLLQTAILAGAAFSDSRLKSNITHIGESNGYKLYSWAWNKLAETLFNLKGVSFGVIAQDVIAITPEAVTEENGYLKVNYSMIGLPHGR